MPKEFQPTILTKLIVLHLEILECLAKFVLHEKTHTHTKKNSLQSSKGIDTVLASRQRYGPKFHKPCRWKHKKATIGKNMAKKHAETMIPG